MDSSLSGRNRDKELLLALPQNYGGDPLKPFGNLLTQHCGGKFVLQGGVRDPNQIAVDAWWEVKSSNQATVFTDWSTQDTGQGIAFIVRENTVESAWREHYWRTPCGFIKDNNWMELLAITAAIEYFHQTCKTAVLQGKKPMTSITIFSDSNTALLFIKNFHRFDLTQRNKCPLWEAIAVTRHGIGQMVQMGVAVELRFCNGHVHTPGNDVADSACKRAIGDDTSNLTISSNGQIRLPLIDRPLCTPAAVDVAAKDQKGKGTANTVGQKQPKLGKKELKKARKAAKAQEGQNVQNNTRIRTPGAQPAGIEKPEHKTKPTKSQQRKHAVQIEKAIAQQDKQYKETQSEDTMSEGKQLEHEAEDSPLSEEQAEKGNPETKAQQPKQEQHLSRGQRRRRARARANQDKQHEETQSKGTAPEGKQYEETQSDETMPNCNQHEEAHPVEITSEGKHEETQSKSTTSEEQHSDNHVDDPQLWMGQMETRRMETKRTVQN